MKYGLTLFALMLVLPGCSLLAATDPSDLTKPDGGIAVDAGDGGPIPCATDCDDHNVCTTDACSVLGQCTHASTCGDGQVCDVTEGCVARKCENNDECDNGLACDGDEKCLPGDANADAVTGCVMGTAPNCDDGASCTQDSCTEEANGCFHEKDNSVCEDGVDCTADVCDPEDHDADSKGCVREADDAFCKSTCFPSAVCNVNAGHCDYGPIFSCGDSNDDCSVNTCDPTMDQCVSTPVDADMDGHRPDICGGGDDCDDNDASVYSGADEVCGNGKDDDCDGAMDEMGCTTVPDKCSSATAIELSGEGPTSVTTKLERLHADGTTVCDDGASAGVDAVFYVDVPSSRDLEVTTEGSSVDTILAVQDNNSACSDSGWGFSCNDDFASTTTASRIWKQGSFFGPHRVFILVKARGGGGNDEIKVNVRLRSAAVLSCGSPAVLDVSAGGAYVGLMPTIGASRGSCQGAGMLNRGTEAVVKFTPTAAGTPVVAAVAAFKPFVYVRASSCANGNEVACTAGNSAGGGLSLALATPTVAAGTTYYGFVDGGKSNNPFTLTYQP